MNKIVKHKKVLVSVFMVAIVAAFNIHITNLRSSDFRDQLALNSFVQAAYASGESTEGNFDDVGESGWSRFWSKIGAWINNSWDDFCEFMDWGKEFSNEAKNAYNNNTEWNTNWGYIDVDPYGNPFKMKGGIKVTLTPNW